ncbi:phospholipase D-like domain-containing protein [Desulfuromonas sp. CSMB_57]|uniref:phospholipase D-like domain-containing protein n=1 Tax=Desulfuromonas sp. CSMB_57 TaxID=2807629 RepID=UPI001CD3AA51|nr:phospholipase D-like domain-containing protein [Desulfuromonas sp. CSMB_57]
MKNEATQKFFELIWSFPATAERVVRVMAKSGHDAVTSEFVERTAGLGAHEKVRIPQILRAMATVGIVTEVGSGLWNSSAGEQEMINLAVQLAGAANFQRVHKDKDEVQVVLTLPEEPSKLCEVLPEQGPYCAKLGATESVFIRIAREARFRLVIVTPFIDRMGAEWIVSMFRLTEGKTVERILILRDYHSAKAALAGIAGELDRLQVRMFDYYIRHEGRRLPFETFHAKFVLGDDTQAYIGSANMLASSLEVALEVGVRLKGRSVLDIKRLVDAMLEVAVHIVRGRTNLTR